MEFIEIPCIISLFPTQAGGRYGPIKNEYTPNAVFGFNLENLQQYWIEKSYLYDEPDKESIKNCGARLQIGESEIYPGGVTNSRLLLTERAKKYVGEILLSAGTTFLIREGSRVIGTGRISQDA